LRQQVPAEWPPAGHPLLQGFGAHPAAAAEDGSVIHRGRFAEGRGKGQVGLDKNAGDLPAFSEPFFGFAFGSGMLCGLPLRAPVPLAPPLRRQVRQRVQSKTVEVLLFAGSVPGTPVFVDVCRLLESSQCTDACVCRRRLVKGHCMQLKTLRGPIVDTIFIELESPKQGPKAFLRLGRPSWFPNKLRENRNLRDSNLMEFLDQHLVASRKTQLELDAT
jgi:hypothetical protein